MHTEYTQMTLRCQLSYIGRQHKALAVIPYFQPYSIDSEYNFHDSFISFRVFLDIA